MPTPEIPQGLGLGPNAIQIYADEMGLDLDAWEVEIVTDSPTGTYVRFLRETTNYKYRMHVYAGGQIITTGPIDKRKRAA